MSETPDTGSYGQFCPVAVSLDVLGDRWTILLLRDMLWSGAIRFTELEERNPGLSNTVLAERIAMLQRHGLVEQLDEPKRRWVLTSEGERISGVVDALYTFGIPLVATAEVDDSMIAYAVADASRRRRMDLIDVEEVCAVEVSVGSGRVNVEIAPGSIRVSEQYAPAATIRMGPSELAALMSGMADVAMLRASASIEIDGDVAAAELVANFFMPAGGLKTAD